MKRVAAASLTVLFTGWACAAGPALRAPTESRADSRAEPRVEGRTDVRSDSRSDPRADPRSDPRQTADPREQRRADLRAAVLAQRAAPDSSQGHRLSAQQRVELREQLKQGPRPAPAGNP